MSITPHALLKQVLKERLALGGGQVPPVITERPPLKPNGQLSPTSLSSGLPWTLKLETPMINRPLGLDYLAETSFNVATLPGSIPPLPAVRKMTSNKWFMASIEQTLTATGYIIVITTDIACHLWMRWTTVQPREHLIQRTKRGLPLMLEKYYCFDVYADNEQEEVGDTLIHTFIKEPWPICETRYFYFQGEIAGVASKSTTAIFSKHRVAPAPAPIEAYFYPDAHPEVSSVDGIVYRQSLANNWSQLVTGIGTAAFDGAIHLTVHIYSRSIAGLWYRCVRTMIVFDTSSIPIGATIVSASLDLKTQSIFDNSGWFPALCLTPCNPASHTALVPADYQTITNTILSHIIPWAAFDLEATETFTLNADGLARIIPGGWTKLALRSHPYDVLNADPGWVSAKQSQLSFYAADTDITKRPRLKVTYLA